MANPSAEMHCPQARRERVGRGVLPLRTFPPLSLHLYKCTQIHLQYTGISNIHRFPHTMVGMWKWSHDRTIHSRDSSCEYTQTSDLPGTSYCFDPFQLLASAEPAASRDLTYIFVWTQYSMTAKFRASPRLCTGILPAGLKPKAKDLPNTQACEQPQQVTSAAGSLKGYSSTVGK